MTKREKIRNIFNQLKDGEKMCEMIETKNLCGTIVGYHQGKSFSCPWPYNYIYVRNYGQWADKATLQELSRELEDCDLDKIVTEREFVKKSGKEFFGWGI